MAITLIQNYLVGGSLSSPYTTADYPSSPTQNNLLVAAALVATGTSVTAVPSGWTEISTGTNTMRAAYKIAGASESSTVTFTSNAVSGSMLALLEYGSVDTTTPFDVSTGSNCSSCSTASTGTTATTAGADSVGVAFLGTRDPADTNISLGTAGSSFTEVDRATLCGLGNCFGLSSNHRFFLPVATYSTSASIYSGTNGYGIIAIFNAASATEYEETLTDDYEASDDDAVADYGKHEQEALTIGSTLASVAAFNDVVSDALELVGIWGVPGLHYPVSDNMDISDDVVILAHFFDTLSEGVDVSDTSVVNGQIGVIIPESLDISDSALHNQVLNLAINEQIVFSMSFIYEGQTYTGVVMNAENYAISEYQAFDFNSMARFGEDYYGAKADGVYQMAGDLDQAATISATLKPGISDMGDDMLKRITEASMGLRNDGTLVLKAIIYDSEAGERREFWYNITDTSEGIRRARVKLGKGLKARYWQFELTNSGGADFEMDNITFHPVILTRRV